MDVRFESLFVSELFEPGHSVAWEFLSGFTYPWEALPYIGEFILELGATLDESEYERRDNNVWVHKTAYIAQSAYIGSDTIICPDAEVRNCAYIRQNALVGSNSVVGNSTELKNSILFDRVQVPHFNYVGDSILGYKSHFGAGVITSNVKSDSSLVTVLYEGERIKTGLKKFGAILGDNVEVGCNAVLNPGTVIGAGSNIYPLSSVRGYVEANSIYKRQGEVVRKED
jgi:NDP-sugar pyrophosphorylase family protein